MWKVLGVLKEDFERRKLTVSIVDNAELQDSEGARSQAAQPRGSPASSSLTSLATLSKSLSCSLHLYFPVRFALPFPLP